MDIVELERKKLERVRELQDLHKDYLWLFYGRKRGKRRADRVRDHLFETCFMWDVMIDQDEPATDLGLAFREGRRSVALHIRYMLEPKNFTDEALMEKIQEEQGYGMD